LIDRHFLSLAIIEAKKCESVSTGYNVGAVLIKQIRVNDSPVIDDFIILSTGFSRELEGNTHAEQCCIIKYNNNNKSNNTENSASFNKSPLFLYSTMEPCSSRLSGNPSCSSLLIQSKLITRCIIGAKEPNYFIAECQGINLLKQSGIEIKIISDMEKDCLEMNQHLIKI